MDVAGDAFVPDRPRRLCIGVRTLLHAAAPTLQSAITSSRDAGTLRAPLPPSQVHEVVQRVDDIVDPD